MTKQLTEDDLKTLSKEDMAARILQLQYQVNVMEEQIAVMEAHRFGRKTEKLNSLSGVPNLFDLVPEMVFNEPETAAEDETQVEEPAEETITVRRKKQVGQRKDDLKDLPVRKEIHEIPEEQLTEIYGENGWKRLPDEVYRRLNRIPASLEVVEHHIAVYAGKKEEEGHIVRADRPADLLRNSIATPSLVASVMNDKYTNAMPLNRISQEFARNDIRISRATLGNWVMRTTEQYLSLVYDKMKEHLIRQSVLQADETTVGVTKDGRPSTSKSYMFVYRTSELQKEHPIILFKYEKTRGHDHAADFLEGFSGILETDAFSGYKALERENSDVQSAFCWAHARRDYADALKALSQQEKKKANSTIAHKALIMIGNIYNMEGNAKDMTPDERLQYRHRKVLPLVEDYFAWVKKQDPKKILSQKTQNGLAYSLNQEKQLRTFLDNGLVPIDNLASERVIRAFAVGRANWHVIDTMDGAQDSAIIYSLVETAKANQLKVYEYLKYLLETIPQHVDVDKNTDFVEDLLPWSPSLPDYCKKTV